MKSGKLTDAQREKKRRKDLISNIITCTVLCLYVGLLFGAVAYRNSEANLLELFELVIDMLPYKFYMILPTQLKYPAIMLVVSLFIDVFLWEGYEKKKGIVTNPNGDAAFEDNFRQFDKEFVINPKVVEETTGKKVKTYYTEEHKKVVTKAVDKKTYAACKQQCQLYADDVALSLDGKWSQRNTNAIIFGASGSGKSRYFLNPNLLQANSCYVITDPSGEIMAGYGAFLEKNGYIVKCLNIADMTKSCRFNPLYYIRDTSDIPIIVTTLMENTQKNKNSSGDDFWQKSTQALLCAIFGYLYEVEPMERRNFYNVLEMLRMAKADEESDGETEFDTMFNVLGEKNPNSYAFKEYGVFVLSSGKTRNNILISTAVLIGTYVDIAGFANLTYKDEMELDKLGAAPFIAVNGEQVDVEVVDQYDIQKDELGRMKEGNPYKVAIFLCIPTADTTYNWLTAMLYSVLFKMLYRRGETRAKQQVQSSPELAMPVRCLIDECANIGKIPNLQEYLATCRKYRLSIVPIFQSFSQITKVYGKEDANSIYANCDTTLFLGGVDSETLKIVCDRLGKESVKYLTNSISNSGKNKTNGTNTAITGRELMSRIQVEQMSNTECLVFIRALKPFKVNKYTLQKHPNYKYTAEANPKEYSYVNPFVLEYDDEEFEAIRIKKCGEEGYTEPKEVLSARLKAQRVEKRKKIEDLLSNYENTLPENPSWLHINGSSSDDDNEYHDSMIKDMDEMYVSSKLISADDLVQRIITLCKKYGIYEVQFADELQTETKNKESKDNIVDVDITTNQTGDDLDVDVSQPRNLSCSETKSAEQCQKDRQNAEESKVEVVTSPDEMSVEDTSYSGGYNASKQFEIPISNRSKEIMNIFFKSNKENNSVDETTEPENNENEKNPMEEYTEKSTTISVDDIDNIPQELINNSSDSEMYMSEEEMNFEMQEEMKRQEEEMMKQLMENDMGYGSDTYDGDYKEELSGNGNTLIQSGESDSDADDEYEYEDDEDEDENSGLY